MKRLSMGGTIDEVEAFSKRMAAKSGDESWAEVGRMWAKRARYVRDNPDRATKLKALQYRLKLLGGDSLSPDGEFLIRRRIVSDRRMRNQLVECEPFIQETCIPRDKVQVERPRGGTD